MTSDATPVSAFIDDSFSRAYVATRIVTPSRTSSWVRYFPAMTTAHWIGRSTRLSTTLRPSSTARRTVAPDANGTKGGGTFTTEWKVYACSPRYGWGNYDETPSSQ